MGFKEIVYSTFSGKIGSFTTESLRLRDEEDPYGRAKETVMKESQIMRMRKEMEALKVRSTATTIPPHPRPCAETVTIDARVGGDRVVSVSECSCNVCWSGDCFDW